MSKIDESHQLGKLNELCKKTDYNQLHNSLLEKPKTENIFNGVIGQQTMTSIPQTSRKDD
jgi:hypothetical protein